MRRSIPSSFISLLLVLLSPLASAERMLTSKSLNPCLENSGFTASVFDVAFTPDNRTLAWDIKFSSSITGNVTISLQVIAYGYNAYSTVIDPCESDDLRGMCPMNTGNQEMRSNAPIPASSLKQVPGITYTVPDLDAKVQVYFNKTDTGEPVACVEAELSNGKTVDQKGVAWVVAVISGLALVASAITSGLGHSNTAAHVAANAMALFGYFQAQAFIGMTSLELPPIVSAWTQNFQWSMGIIRVGFLQTLATWYQRATGGAPATVLSDETSVSVQKRGLELGLDVVQRAVTGIYARTNGDGTTSSTPANIVLRGIERVGYVAGIETTNIFLTGYIFFVIFVLFVVLGVVLFKFVCEALVRAGHMKGEKFVDFRNGWTTVLKGILFRIVLIGYPQMVVLCLWEFTKKDSGAEVTLAVFTLFSMLAILAWASSKVIRLARRSIAMHKNPAYILYSDPVSLNKWGFLYVQFKATAYFFIVPVLIYIFIKGLFIGVAQGSPTAQAVALVIIEALYLIGVSVLRPYMDKKTNAFNIAICAINFVSAVFLLFFANVFGQPQIVNGVMGVIFFVYNAAFSLVLLIIVMVASSIAIFSKNPESRYQPMRDDRGSFIKSATQLNTELDALGATARGETKHGMGARIEDDDDSWSGSSEPKQPIAQTTYTGSGMHVPAYGNDDRHAPPYDRSANATPFDNRTPSMTSSQQQHRFRQQAASPWQRGAGYD